MQYTNQLVRDMERNERVWDSYRMPYPHLSEPSILPVLPPQIVPVPVPVVPPAPSPAPVTPTPAATSSSTIIWIILIVVAILFLFYLIMSRKSKGVQRRK